MYGFDELKRDIACWQEAGAECGIIGKSALGRELYYVRIGDTSRHRAVVTAGIHAREHIASFVVAEQIYYTLAHLDALVGGIVYLPMLNPDGIELCIHGLRAVKDRAVAQFLRRTNGSTDFSLWKANAHAVDLNCNFPALWGTGTQNVYAPAPQNYVGLFPLCEPETSALVAFTHRARPSYTVSYHAKGREIYWEFGQSKPLRARDLTFAKACAKITGYKLVSGTQGSAGGYKDYCISALAIPSLTVELVDDSALHPISYAVAGDEVRRTKTLGIALNKTYEELWKKKILCEKPSARQR